MGERPTKPPATVPVLSASGNDLFEQAVAAIRLDDTTVRWLAVSTLGTIGAVPAELTAEELANLLPELERRLRKLVPDEQADAAVRRLQHVLFDHAGRS